MSGKKNGGAKKANGSGEPEGLGRVQAIKDMKAETLVGDVRDLLLQEFRDAKQGLPWTVRSEKDQREVIDRISNFATDIIHRAFELFTEKGERSIRVMVRQWRVKDGVQIQVDALRSSDVIQALSESGVVATLVLIDPSQFEESRGDISPSPDQRRLGLTEDDDDFDGPPPRGPNGNDSPPAGDAEPPPA